MGSAAQRAMLASGMGRRHDPSDVDPRDGDAPCPVPISEASGCMEMQLPAVGLLRHKTDNTLVKALARAFRWKRMLESGEFVTIAKPAEREGIAPSYMTRVLRLTLLAPEIVEAILDGRQGATVTLA